MVNDTAFLMHKLEKRKKKAEVRSKQGCFANTMLQQKPMGTRIFKNNKGLCDVGLAFYCCKHRILIKGRLL